MISRLGLDLSIDFNGAFCRTPTTVRADDRDKLFPPRNDK